MPHYISIRYLNHHDGNLKSCKGNSLSSGQILLLFEINGWMFALILLHGQQPQQQNSALQLKFTNEEYAITIFLPNIIENHNLRLAILILWSLSGPVNTGFLTCIPPFFQQSIMHPVFKRAFQTKTFTLNPSYIFQVDIFLQAFPYTRKQMSSHQPDTRKV